MGTVGSFGVGPYSATKAGVQGLTRTLPVEQAAQGVRVNCVCLTMWGIAARQVSIAPRMLTFITFSMFSTVQS